MRALSAGVVGQTTEYLIGHFLEVTGSGGDHTVRHFPVERIPFLEQRLQAGLRVAGLQQRPVAAVSSTPLTLPTNRGV